MTKVEAIRQVMLDNGGAATLKMIYAQIEAYYPEAKTSEEWQAGIRGVLYRDVGRLFKKISDATYAVLEYNEELFTLPNREIDTAETEREVRITMRKLQQKFRKDLLAAMPACPITGITDNRLLLAGHIKPWCFSDGNERIDIYNGLTLSPLYDRLFDRGLITFTDDKVMLISKSIEHTTRERLCLVSKVYPALDLNGREKYLQFHRDFVFLD